MLHFFHPHAFNNLGNAMKDRGKFQEALRCYEKAIQINPNFAAAHSNLASLLKERCPNSLSQAAP